MPNIVTHTLFADDVLGLLDAPELNSRRQLFEVGSNGPDILFFHHMNPKSVLKKTPLHHMGSVLHEEYTNDFYASALDSIRKEKNPQIREDMIAYTAGHLCHWALDSTAHPYIFCRTGNCKGQSASDHHRFESILDSLMLKLKRDETIRDYDVAEAVCRTSPEIKRAVARIYVPALNAIFETGIQPHEIAETLDDWHFMQKVFHDPSGKKIRMARHLEKLIGRPNQFSGFAVPSQPEDNYDIMNLLHRTWHNPQSGEACDRDFLMLYDEAIGKAVTAIHLFLNACAEVHSKEAEKEFLGYLNNRNYESGLPEFGELEHFDLVDLS